MLSSSKKIGIIAFSIFIVYMNSIDLYWLIDHRVLTVEGARIIIENQ